MKKIPLTQGKFALVDDEDFERLSKFKWYAEKVGRVWYARCHLKELPSEGGKRKRIRPHMHRKILDLPSSVLIDHKDRDGLNNQKNNLRASTNSQNQANSAKFSKKCSSRFRGVSWDKSRGTWMVQFQAEGKTIHLGRFSDEIEAARVSDTARLKYHGPFAFRNFPG
jgi:hypothetical protein